MRMRRYNVVTSSVGLLASFLTAPEVAGDNGPFSISVSSPAYCTTNTFTYSSEMAMATGSFDIDPGLYGMGQPGQKWTFTVSPGVVLDSDTWGDDGQHIDSSIVQNADGSYTFTVPSDGSWLGGMITGEANAPGCDPNQPWLETVGVSAATSNASTASSQTSNIPNLLSQSSLSSSVGLNAAGPSSRVSTSAASPFPFSSSSSSPSPSSSYSYSSSPASLSSNSANGPSGSTTSSISSYTSIAGAPGSGPTSSGSSISGSSALSSSSISQSTQTSQAVYVNPNPLGCSTIIPSEINPILYSTVTGLSCVCQGTTLPLLPTASNKCGYQSLPPASPAQTSASTAAPQTSSVSSAAGIVAASGSTQSSASIPGASSSAVTAAGVPTTTGSAQGISASVSGISTSAGAGAGGLLSSSGSGQTSSGSVSTGSNPASNTTPSSVLTGTVSSFNVAGSQSSTAVSSSFASLGASSLGSLGSSGSYPLSTATSVVAYPQSQTSSLTASTFGASSSISINSLSGSSGSTSLASSLPSLASSLSSAGSAGSSGSTPSAGSSGSSGASPSVGSSGSSLSTGSSGSSGSSPSAGSSGSSGSSTSAGLSGSSGSSPSAASSGSSGSSTSAGLSGSSGSSPSAASSGSSGSSTSAGLSGSSTSAGLSGSSGSSPLLITTSVGDRMSSQTSLPTASTFGSSSPVFVNSLLGSSSSASPGSSASAGISPSTSPGTQSVSSQSLATGLGTMFSPSASLAASPTGCPGAPQCVLVPKGFDDQCLDADWAYCYCNGSPAPLVTSWMGDLIMPNCDYSTIPPSQCPGSPVIPFVPTQSGASVVEVDGKLVIHPKLKRAIATTSMSSASCAMPSGASSFTLTISATLPCTAPLETGPPAYPCTRNATSHYIPPLTAEQWEVQGVDEFWQTYFENTTHWQEEGLMKTFFQDFSGGLYGDGTEYVCSATNEVSCLFLEDCSLIATGPESWLTPYSTQAYYIWAGMTNFSKMLNMMWQALQWAAQDMNYFAGEVGEKFEVQLPAASLWSKIFPILNTILTLFAIIFIIADPFVDAVLAPVVGVLVGLAAAFGLAADVDNFIASSSQAEITIDTIYSNLGFSNGWIQFLQDEISFMHDSMWINGTYNGNGTTKPTDASQLMTGGAYLASSQVIANIDLNTTDRHALVTGPTNAVTAWFENLLVANLINNWYKSSNVYIVYIPYGQVKSLTSPNEMVTFTQDDCNNEWIGNPKYYLAATSWNDSVVASCEDGGMAVLMNGGSTMQKPSFYEIANMTYNENTYSAYDMIKSSLNGFLNYGFNYNATDSFVADLLDPTAENLANVTQYLHLEPTSPGVYNLDVCRLYDLTAVPNAVLGPWTPADVYPGWPAQRQPCPCMSDEANITIGGVTTYFRDVAASGITDSLNGLIKKSGSKDDTCPVVPKGELDCDDFPSAPTCYPISSPF